MVTAERAKFIRLGLQNNWAPLCIDDGTIRLGFNQVPHEVALQGRDAVAAHLPLIKYNKKQIKKDANQVCDFYEAGSETIWVTFHAGCLWWAQTASKVELLGYDEVEHPNGCRLRRTLRGWSNRSLSSRGLFISELAGYLSAIRRFQGTLCNLNPQIFDYLMRRINDQDLPEAVTVRKAQADLKVGVMQLIQRLTPKDFELFADIIFSRSGWARVSPLGGTMSDIDMEYIMPVSEERVVVQVKSRTNQAQLREYEDRLKRYPADRVFYVYHTSADNLQSSDPRFFLMGFDNLADAALHASLTDWLVDRV